VFKAIIPKSSSINLEVKGAFVLTIEELAAHWSLRPAAIRARVKSGELSAVRVGGRYRVSWPDVWACETGSRPTGALADRYRTPLATKSDVAQAMRVSTRTVERWIADGLPTRCVGGNVRMNRAEVAGWIKQRFGIDVRDMLERAP
jgi:excisionase family DNA binding protein